MDSNSNRHSSSVKHSPHPKATHFESYRHHVQGGSEDGPAELSSSRTSHPSRPVKSITSPKKLDSSALVPKPINAVTNEDIQAERLPVPIPDVGLSSANHAPTTLFVHPGLMPATKPTSSIVALPQNSPVPTFMMEPGSSATESYVPFPSFPPQKKAANASSNHLLVVIFASLGGAFLLVIVFVLFRIRSRPRRRYHPTPSLPILQDPFPDRPAEESPIFGGKERFSSTLGDDEKWTWTQYHSKPPEKDWQNRTKERNTSVDPDDKVSYLHPSNDGLLSVQPPLRKRPNFLSRSLSRVSTLSAYSTSKSEVAGLLANTPRSSSLTADPFLDRVKTRSSYRRSKDKNTLRITVKDWDAEDPERYIYGGAEVMPAEVLPVIVEPPPATHVTGRQRIKAPYVVGSCPSLNSIAPSISSQSIVSDPFEDTQFVGAYYVKTEARRERDTKALTAALGLPLSPPGGAVPHHAGTSDGRKNIPGSPIDPSMQLGNFMMSDYPETALDTKPLKIPRDSLGGPQRIRLVDDKPPRVPSPPPMPSLIQMAMAHNNGLDYDTYRSPTYSLYDMYANTRSVYVGKPD